MDLVTRRKFLLASGVAGAAAITAGAAAFTIGDILGTAGSKDPTADAKTLVLITLYGGNDGLNTVVPYADSAYHSSRPGISYMDTEVLHLDDKLGLNPAMKGFAGLFAQKRLAIIRGVGYPKPDHSHFRSMDIWQTADPTKPINTGWLGRWLDATGGDPRHAVSFEPVLPVLLAGARSAGAAVPLSGLKFPGGMTTRTIAGLAKPTTGEPVLQARAARAFADLVDVDQMVRKINSTPDSSTPAGRDNAPKATGTGGRGALAQQLNLVARCVESKVVTKVFSVSLGGFDTHADERGTQERLLGQLDAAVTAFVERLSGTDAGRNVIVAIYSEFGRRVAANASDGTDHGTASDVFVLGAPVKGGFYGDQPSLTKLDDGDLKMTTDFRDLYASLLEHGLKIDPGKVLGPWKGQVKGLFG